MLLPLLTELIVERGFQQSYRLGGHPGIGAAGSGYCGRRSLHQHRRVYSYAGHYCFYTICGWWIAFTGLVHPGQFEVVEARELNVNKT